MWYIDSGASSHMTEAREMFSELSQAGIDVEVVLGISQLSESLGVGPLYFKESP